MPTHAQVVPTRQPVSATARLGSPRYFPAIAPFIRAHLTLRRVPLVARPGARADAEVRRVA